MFLFCVRQREIVEVKMNVMCNTKYVHGVLEERERTKEETGKESYAQTQEVSNVRKATFFFFAHDCRICASVRNKSFMVASHLTSSGESSVYVAEPRNP